MYKDKVSKIVLKELYSRGFNIFTDNIKNKAEFIVNRVLSGVFAFQLIYDENNEVVEVIDLDWRLVKFSNHITGETIISIDGGKRYQWSYNEILLIDIDTVRDWKINSILD